MRLPKSAVVVALLVTLTACGKAADTSSPAVPRPSRSTQAVLYDGTWTVREGVWFLTDGKAFPAYGRADRLIDASVPGALWLHPPALYGKFRIRVLARPTRPRLPSWCQDVVEVSLHSRGAGLTMGGFQELSHVMPLAAGSYRVRYCVAGQDAAARESTRKAPASGYRLYSSRQLLQLWPAPPAPSKLVKVTSRFAHDVLHR